jgi:hypothetical protein
MAGSLNTGISPGAAGKENRLAASNFQILELGVILEQ